MGSRDNVEKVSRGYRHDVEVDVVGYNVVVSLVDFDPDAPAGQRQKKKLPINQSYLISTLSLTEQAAGELFNQNL